MADNHKKDSIPFQLIADEVSNARGAAWLKDRTHIERLYDVYTHGKAFLTEGTNGNYTPADLRYKKTASFIDKEARFLFSRTPDCKVVSENVNLTDEEKARINQDLSVFQSLIDSVLKANLFNKRLIRAAKDCFIGKRIAMVLNFNDSGISLSFVPSLQFVYETDERNSDRLYSISTFHNLAETPYRVYKKKYWIESDGYCWVKEEIFDDAAKLIDTPLEARQTKFTYVPAVVLLNDGLLGDAFGVSDVELLSDYESWYSRLANADMDAERKSMNPTRYTVDASTESTKDLSIAAGSFWDIATDQNTQNPNQKAQVGLLEPAMSYVSALKATLDRMNDVMHETIDMPNTSPEALKGVVSSGKTLRAIYWSLIVRCDEKMLTWRPCLEFILESVINGAKLYPNSARVHVRDAIPDNTEFSIVVENQYPIQEEESEEKLLDIQEVTADVMSRKSYIKKWRNLTDEEADLELIQIVKEKRLFEESYFPDITLAPESDL